MKKLTKIRFTLIELLVVVAIIGILATVVLASLGSARTKAKDAAIKAEVSGIRASAEIIYLDASPDSYADVCATVDSVITAGGIPVTYCDADEDAWVAYKTLANGDNDGFCSDSTGAAKETAAVNSGTVCP